MKNKITNKNYQFLILITSLIGSIMSVVSGIITKINVISVTKQFGMIQELPFIFWLGFAIMFITLLLGIKIDSNKIFFIKSLIFFVLIWNIPTIFENNFSVWDSSFHFKNSLIINNIIKEAYAPYPSDWPGFFIFGFFLYKISFLPVLTFLKYYRILASALGFIAVWFFFRRFREDEDEFRHCILLSTLLTVWHQFHYSPQSLGFGIGLFVIVLTRYNSIKAKLGIFLLGGFLVISHPTTFLILIMFLAMWSVFSFFGWRIKKEKYLLQDAKKIFFVFYILAILWTGWLFFEAENTSNLVGNVIIRFTDYAIVGGLTKEVVLNTKSIINEQTYNLESLIYESKLDKTNNLSSDSNSILEQKLSPLKKDGYLSQSPKIRLLVLIIISFLTVIYFVNSVMEKRFFDKKTIFLFSWIFSLSILIIFLQLFSYLNLRDRVFLYYMVISPFILVGFIKIFKSDKFKTLLWILFYLLALFMFITIYSEEATYLVSDSFVYLNRFVTNNIINLDSEYYDYILIKNIQDSFSRDSPENGLYVVSTPKFNWGLLKGGILKYQIYFKKLEYSNKDKIYSNSFDQLYSD